MLLSFNAFASEALPTLHIVSCSIPEEAIILNVGFTNFTYDFCIDETATSCKSVLEQLNAQEQDTSVYFVNTSDPDYMELITSGACQDLSGVQYFHEKINRMPSSLSAPCYHESVLYAIPICILPENDNVVVAILNPHAISPSQAAALIDQYLVNLPTELQSQLWPDS